MINAKYSYKDFTGKDFSKVDKKEFEGQGDIVGSCFYQECLEGEIPKKSIFPNIKGVNFIRCNLDNVVIPKYCTVDGTCTCKRIKVQNDLSDWELDEDLKPISPMDKGKRIKKGISVDPKDIPLTKATKYILEDMEVI